MKKRIYLVLVLCPLLLASSVTLVKAQGTYCNSDLRFCMATSYYSWDTQISNTAFYATVSSGIYYSASIEPYGSDHYGFVWIQYGGGNYTIESDNEGFKSQNGVFSSSGEQWIDIFAEANRAHSYVSVSW